MGQIGHFFFTLSLKMIFFNNSSLFRTDGTKGTLFFYVL